MKLLLDEQAKKRLRQVIRVITLEPRKLYMNRWLNDLDKSEPIANLRRDGFVGGFRKRTELPPCGTVGCIAGWLVSLEHGDRAKEFVTQEEAGRLLGLKHDDVRVLFLPTLWPERFHNLLNRERDGTPEYASVVSKRIRYYIRFGK